MHHHSFSTEPRMAFYVARTQCYECLPILRHRMMSIAHLQGRANY